MFFSARVSDDTINPITAAEQAARNSGEALLNLSDSNPTRCGLGPVVLPGTYIPNPQGPELDRRALAEFLERDQSRVVSPQHLYLLSSTSQGYAYLMKLLCDSGDVVLAPVPGYPLVEQIANLEEVRVIGYPLQLHDEWRIDLTRINEILGSPEGGRVRAIVAINPNNPTGSYLQTDEIMRLSEIAAEHDIAIIADEVFHEYPLHETGRSASRFAGNPKCLTFALDGLSKQLAAPQAKVAWIECSGPGPTLAAAQRRLDVILDAFLPTSTIIAERLPELLAAVPTQRERVLERCRENLSTLRNLVATHPSVNLLEPAGGWSALLRFPAHIDEDSLVTRLIGTYKTTVQPGYFFDMPLPGFVSVSLLLPPTDFRSGTEKLLVELQNGC
ncbi:MAG: pyridoxal phosphate-dependent aminotransferase [Varibaculum sp.]|nr:pyridoxal phosphate-dependent aminotransferase [Varibaculum sp.]